MKTQKNCLSHLPDNSKFISLYTAPVVPSNYYPSIIFQLLTTSYFVFLIFVGLAPSMNNLRIVLYAIMYFVNQCLRNLLVFQDALDDLGLFPTKKLLTMLRLLVKANMLYLLIRLTINTYSLSVTVLLVLFCINQIYRPQNKNRSQMNTNSTSSRINSNFLGNGGFSLLKIFEVANPILVYCFSKTLYAQLAQLSILFLVFFSFNLIMTNELRQLIWLDQSTLFGWKDVIISETSTSLTSSVASTESNSPKFQPIWNKKQTFKGIIATCTAVLAIQNFMLIFQSIKQQMCLVIIQTLLIAIVAQLMGFILFEEQYKYLGSKKKLNFFGLFEINYPKIRFI